MALLGAFLALPASSAAAAGAVVQKASVTISDAGFSPASVALEVGGTVTWVNRGSVVHTASSTSAPAVFNTGGLGPNQSDSATLTVPGTYHYSSATDCLNGNSNPAFACSASYTVVVTTAPVGSISTTPVPLWNTTLVYLEDGKGFDPPAINIKAGQTVSWLDLGLHTHSVVSDTGLNPQFDSGALSTGSSFSVTFERPGTYTYHSSTEPIYSPGSPPVLTGYRYTGSVIVH